MKKTITTGIAGILIALFSASPAFALQGEPMNLAAIRHQNAANRKAINQIRIEGNLTCNLGAANNGQGCALKIMDSKTGRVFNLIEANNAMRLYLDGAKKVAIEGTMADAETIQVRKAETL